MSVGWPTQVKDDPKAPFSTAATPVSSGGHNFFLWIAQLTLDLYFMILNVK